MENLPDFGKLEILRLESDTSEFRSYEMQWTIPNYSKLKPEIMHTMHNLLIGKDNLRFTMFKTYNKKRNVFSPTDLVLTLSPYHKVSNARFSIIGANNREIIPTSLKFHLNVFIPGHRALFVETPDIFVDDTLTISATVILTVKSKGLSIFESMQKQDNTALGNLFQSGKYADLQIVVGETTFLAHTAVLCARSAVFTAMFENNLKENVEKRFKIDDADAESVEEMLNFIYTGETKQLNLDLASILFQLADKYDLKGLRFKVASFLMHTMSMSHALRTLVLADMHNHRDLKDCATDYIGKNLSLAMQHEDWETLRELHNDLFENVLERVAEFAQQGLFENDDE